MSSMLEQYYYFTANTNVFVRNTFRYMSPHCTLGPILKETVVPPIAADY